MRDGDFRIRGKEISRVEGLSDAVFGFAITLLVVSLEVPKTSDEVLHAMRGFFAFAITFSLLFLVWRTQFTFFRRYGLEDNTTVTLNAVLLFVILFFVYPLKFVFTAFVERVLVHAGFPDPSVPNVFKDEHAPLLMLTYALGWSAVFGVFALLHRHAYRKREELQLNDVEEFDTREGITTHVAVAVVGLILAATYFAVYRSSSQSDGDRISLGMSVLLGGMLLWLARRKRRARGRRRAMLVSMAAGEEA
jgi:uncharacterized membrane protein